MCDRTGPGSTAASAAASSAAAPPGERTGEGRPDELAGRETATASAAEAVIGSVSDPEFRLAVEVLYHGSREAFFLGAHRWVMFATILLGASAAVAFGYDKLFGLLAAAAAAADIAFDFTGRAQAHADFRRRYYDMVAELASTGLVENYGRRWMAISADEPPVYRIVEDIAYRNACIALGREVPDLLPLWKRLAAHVLRG